MNSLFSRLTAFFLLVLLLLGFFILWLADRGARNYFLEFSQQLNSPIAMYMAQNARLLRDGQPDGTALQALAEHVTMVNPSVEVYLLSESGEVLAHTLNNQPERQQIRMEPVRDFLSGARSFPIFGDNPRDATDSRTFSVHPLEQQGRIRGYVYAVLTGERHQTLLDAISSSYTLKNVWITTISVLAFALLAGCVVFFMLTHRLRQLTARVQQLQRRLGDIGGKISVVRAAGFGTASARNNLDELDELTFAYETMANELIDQYQLLQRNDRTRRELFANISHDLRTPLTTLQGYLETLQLKQGQLGNPEMRRFVKVAHRQSLRLRDLVTQLFELSKMSSGELELNAEQFSVAELAHDCAQDFRIQASRDNIEIVVQTSPVAARYLDVCADISLIQRIFENLLSNALRFTPVDGRIAILISRSARQFVSVTVSDSGVGMSVEQADRIFDRHFRSVDCDQHNGQHAGLGLTIVRGILDLHGCDIRVASEPGQGATFQFTLPAAIVLPVLHTTPRDAAEAVLKSATG